MYYPLYYSQSANFGDALNPILYKYITGRDCQWTSPDSQVKILACGSIAERALPMDIIWGSGLLSQDAELKCSVTTQLTALRGPLTAELIYNKTGKMCEVCGDPGLLIADYIEPSKKNRKIGILPHYTDRDIVTNDPVLKENYIDIMSGVESVIRQVTECEAIYTSALHGIICAEAYGIPAVWVEFSESVAGKGFKFRDYYLGTNREPPNPLDWRSKRELIEIDWEPPTADVDLLLEVCPFNWNKTDYKRWQKVDEYKDRNVSISHLIDEGASLLEFGAGNESLRKLIPSSCKYTGSDIFKRFPQTIVCDLNTGRFIDLSGYDTIVLSGVLEYIYISRFEEFLEYAKQFPIKTFICSYNHVASREHNGWVNDLSRDELLDMFCQKGYTLDRDYGGVYKFIR